MAYSGLTDEKVSEYREEEFSEEQIDRLNNRAIKKINDKLQKFTVQRPTTGASWSENELRLVLLGKTGEGKSSTGNLILGKEAFKDSPSTKSETQHIHEARCFFDQTLVRVIDTPGFHDTHRGPEAITTEIAKVMDAFSHGIHGFLFVFSVSNPRFTKDQEDAFKTLSSESGLFGPEFLKHCFVILSHGNDMVTHHALEDFLAAEAGSAFGNLIRGIGRRTIAVDNGDKESHSREGQRKQVLKLIMSSALGAYDHDVLRQFKEHQEQTRRNTDERVRDMVPLIEEALSELLEQMPHANIKRMDSETKRIIIQRVFTKVKDTVGSNTVPDEYLQQTIMEVLTEKQTRLTSDTFLDKVKSFAAPLLAMAAQLLPVLLDLLKNVLRA